MNGENASKEIVRSFVDLANIVKGPVDENQQLSVTQVLGRLFPSTRGGGRRGESRELLRVGDSESSASATDTNNTSFVTRSTIKRAIEEIWGSKATSRKLAILFHIKPSDFKCVILVLGYLVFHN